MIRKNEKILKAYNFMLNVNRAFSLQELSNASGWKITTIKTYINKQWKDFITSNNEGNYVCKELTGISQEEFVKIHSQKLKYKSSIYSQSESLLIKARQFSLLAVYVYNNPYSEFNVYGYIVNIIIAWTALFHAVFQRNGIDYFHKDKNGDRIPVNKGEYKVWDLNYCLDQFWQKDVPSKANLKLLMELRNKIEHSNLPLIELKFAGHCQACLNNFETVLIQEFGAVYALKRNITLALQLTKIHEQTLAIKDIQSNNFQLIEQFLDHFEEKLPNDFLRDPTYRVSYFLMPKISNHKTSADVTIEFIKPDSDEGTEINRILLKEIEKEKFKPKQIVDLMKQEGFPKFNIHLHTQLWKSKKAKSSGNYGVKLKDGSWYWYSNWVNVVREHCKKNLS